MNETELVIEMQERLMNLTPESYGETLKFICDSVDRNHPDRAFMVETNVMGAVEYRPKSISELARLSKDFAIFLAGSNEIEKIQQVHKIFFVNPVVYFNSAFALFSRNCVENGLISAEYFVHLMREFRTEHSESVYEYLTFFSWFCPEIEKYDPELYGEILQFFKKKGQMPNLLSSLKFVIDNFDDLRADDWKRHKEVVKSLVGTEPIAQALLHDNVEQLKELMAKPGFDINMRMKPNVFCFTKFLQRYPTLVQFCGFLGSEKCFQLLLDAGADVELCNYANRTVVHFLVAGGNRNIIEASMKAECDFTGALQIAALYHRNDIFEWLYEHLKVPLDATDDSLGAVIHQAAKSNNLKIVKFCIDNGIDPNTRNAEKCTALHLASECGSIDIVEYLLSLPTIEVNARDVIRRTPLHYACDNGNYSTVVRLLKHKDVDVNAKNKEIRSPLMCAVIVGRRDTVELLLDDPNIDARTIDGNGMTPLHWAARNNRPETLTLLIEKLGIDINSRADDGKTALHWAAVNGFIEIIRILLAHPSIDVNAKADEGTAPIHAALQGGHVRAIQELIECPKTDVNAQNTQGLTALHMAAASGDSEIVALLMSCKRVNPKLKNKAGATPMEVAKQFNHMKVFDIMNTFSGDKMIFVH